MGAIDLPTLFLVARIIFSKKYTFTFNSLAFAELELITEEYSNIVQNQMFGEAFIG